MIRTTLTFDCWMRRPTIPSRASAIAPSSPPCSIMACAARSSAACVSATCKAARGVLHFRVKGRWSDREPIEDRNIQRQWHQRSPTSRHGRAQRGSRDGREGPGLGTRDPGGRRATTAKSSCASCAITTSPGTLRRSSQSSAIDSRTSRYAGYAISQRKRKRVEEIFGWLKTVGGLRKTCPCRIPIQAAVGV
jgi:hypothetical protein